MGGSSEGCLKWGGGGHQGIFPKTSQNMEWVKAKVACRGQGCEGVTNPAPPPPENFNHTLGYLIISFSLYLFHFVYE